MEKPFTHDDIEFVVKVRTEADVYIVKVYFLSGDPANHKTAAMTFENSDNFKSQYGYPGVEQLMRDEEEYVKEGNYYGSGTYDESDFI